MKFLYSVNDEQFYYSDKDRKICLNKEEHEQYEYQLECERWRPMEDEDYAKLVTSYSKKRLKKYFITGK